MKRIILGVIGVVILIVVVTAFLAGNTSNNNLMGSAKTSPAQPDKATPVATNKINIQDFAFTQPNVIVHKGDTITWTNLDDAHHNVNISDGPEKSEGPLLAKGETYKKTFNFVGIYKYHCTPHPYMKATLEVSS